MPHVELVSKNQAVRYFVCVIFMNKLFKLRNVTCIDSPTKEALSSSAEHNNCLCKEAFFIVKFINTSTQIEHVWDKFEGMYLVICYSDGHIDRGER